MDAEIILALYLLDTNMTIGVFVPLEPIDTRYLGAEAPFFYRRLSELFCAGILIRLRDAPQKSVAVVVW